MSAGTPIGEDFAWLDGVITRGRRNAEFLTDREITFLDGLLLSLERYGAKTFLSVKQRNWLKSIDRRLDEAGIPAEEN